MRQFSLHWITSSFTKLSNNQFHWQKLWKTFSAAAILNFLFFLSASSEKLATITFFHWLLIIDCCSVFIYAFRLLEWIISRISQKAKINSTMHSRKLFSLLTATHKGASRSVTETLWIIDFVRTIHWKCYIYCSSC